MSFPRYAEYKDSGVEWLGDVPSDWTVDRLKWHLIANDGGVWGSDPSGEGDTLVLRSTEQTVDGRWQINDPAFRYLMTAEKEAALLVAGDLLLTKSSGSALHIGKTTLVDEEVASRDCCYSNFMQRLRPATSLVPKLGWYILNSRLARELFDLLSNSTTGLANLNGSIIAELLIPVAPSDAEQSAVVAFLDRETAKIDALVAEQEKLITLLAEKRQAVISHAVTKGLNPAAPMKDSGIKWLGEVPAHWRMVRIKYLTRSIEQGWSPQCEGFPVESPEEWGVLKVGCVNGGTFNPDENKTLPAELEPIPSLGIVAGDLLISRANTRELVGGAAVAFESHPRLMLCDKLYRLRLDADLCLPEFLSLFLGTGLARGKIELAATGASSSMLNIGQGTILEMETPVPPIAEQSAIAAHIQAETVKLDTLAAEARCAINLLKEHRSALISAAVTGKIDVRGLVDVEAA